MAEVTGPPGSGRTETLLRLSEARSEALFVDATGLTCEDVIERVMSAAGCATLPEKRSDWGFELEDSPLRGGLVIIVNAHRAGRTRRSSEPERMVHRFIVELAVVGRLKVVIERDLPDVRGGHNHLVVALRPAPVGEAPGLVPDGAAAEVLRALALAEVRRAPMPVWTALAQALEPHVGRSLPVAATLEAAGDFLEVDGDGCVRFRDERHAEVLRRTTAAEVVRAVNGELVASKVPGEPLFDDSGFVPALHHGPALRRDAYDPDLFEPGVVRRLPAGLLPDGVTDTEARRVLTNVGLPAFQGAALRIEPLNEAGLPLLSPDAPEEDSASGPYFKIGLWGGGDLALHGETGQVIVLGADDWSSTEDDFDELRRRARRARRTGLRRGAGLQRGGDRRQPDHVHRPPPALPRDPLHAGLGVEPHRAHSDQGRPGVHAVRRRHHGHRVLDGHTAIDLLTDPARRGLGGDRRVRAGRYRGGCGEGLDAMRRRC
ncbi:SUKH-4 family immunity protein [Streptomyces sp. NPDC003514]